MAGIVAGDSDSAPALALLDFVRDVVRMSVGTNTGEVFKKDCTDLVRRIVLLTHLFEEIRDFNGVQFRPVDASPSSSSSGGAVTVRDSSQFPWLCDLVAALKDTKRLVFIASTFRSCRSSSEEVAKKILFQFQCVTWKLEKALGNLPYDRLDISEEVQEQVELVRAQLRRAAEKYGSLTAIPPSVVQSQLLKKNVDLLNLNNRVDNFDVEENGIVDHEITVKFDAFPNCRGLMNGGVDQLTFKGPEKLPSSSEACSDGQDDSARKSGDQGKNPDGVSIPDDFLCPISLEIMRDPVIVSTGQTYERSYVQRWIDCGNTTCPKTQQKLQNLTLTPNYVLRSLISQWCVNHNIEQPTGLTNGKIKKCDGSYRDVCEEMAAIETLVRKLTSHAIEEQRASVTELRSLSKRSTDNRILIAEAGAIPALVNLLTSDDVLIQENAVTSILNLSIYENNKGLIMLAGAVPSIVQVLRVGSMEARENAAATLFSLSLADENRIIIGASGAIPALVDLLENGSSRGKKDAATALFNLCIYQGNKGRAVRAGIIPALLKMLTDSVNNMIDEALTIMSVLASHQEAKVAMVKASTIPVLIDLLRTGLSRNKENAAAILLALCKRDTENLSCISRLGAVIPLTELAKSGTERAKRKATSLLEHLRKLQQL
ncbi:U-box domain-containing protein 11-like [Benincasa hispida]|uniref:U-box domain-containing protein 11-like n=1 Tax=Benincasa hispida TaxID=102211 RepID=UPI0018FF4386|nr:U-box domain-containing protein 11-like [Benincasa hispida]